MKEETFLEFKRRIKWRKKTGVKNIEGKIIVYPGEVKEIYKNFYEELFEKLKWDGGKRIAKDKGGR